MIGALTHQRRFLNGKFCMLDPSPPMGTFNTARSNQVSMTLLSGISPYFRGKSKKKIRFQGHVFRIQGFRDFQGKMRKFLKSGVFLGNFRINNEKCQISKIWQLLISAENEFRDFDFRPIGLRTLGLWEVDSSYLAALVALPRQAVQQTIFVIKYSNVFKRKRVCMYSLLRFLLHCVVVYILRSSSVGGKSIQSAQVDKDGPQESTGFRLMFQSVESKFGLKALNFLDALRPLQT